MTFQIHGLPLPWGFTFLRTKVTMENGTFLSVSCEVIKGRP